MSHAGGDEEMKLGAIMWQTETDNQQMPRERDEKRDFKILGS